MAQRLLPLAEIPTRSAKSAEREARAMYPSRAAALTAARYEIIDAEGCYSGLPRTYGWVCSRAAAEAVAAERTHMPGNTAHCARRYVASGP